MYKSTKTYGHDVGLSVAFRQWRAKSKCHFIHGYALKIRLEFSANELDKNNWVVDFGNMKRLKQALQDLFDHKMLVARDDPHLDWLMEAHNRGIADVVTVESTGCEKFAEMVYNMANAWLISEGYSPRCRLDSVEVSEHGANSAIYIPESK